MEVLAVDWFVYMVTVMDAGQMLKMALELSDEEIQIEMKVCCSNPCHIIIGDCPVSITLDEKYCDASILMNGKNTSSAHVK